MNLIPRSHSRIHAAALHASFQIHHRLLPAATLPVQHPPPPPPRRGSGLRHAAPGSRSASRRPLPPLRPPPFQVLWFHFKTARLVLKIMPRFTNRRASCPQRCPPQDPAITTAASHPPFRASPRPHPAGRPTSSTPLPTELSPGHWRKTAPEAGLPRSAPAAPPLHAPRARAAADPARAPFMPSPSPTPQDRSRARAAKPRPQAPCQPPPARYAR